MYFRKSRRVGGIVAAASIAALALAGCSANSSAEESSTLKFITFQGGDAGVKYENLISAFEAANPGVTVDMEVLTGDDTYNSVITSRISGGTSPDIFDVVNGNLDPFVDADLLTDLSDQPWIATQVEAVQNLAERFDGKTYSYVPELSTGGVFYNTDLFTEYGVDVPENWNDFLAAVETFRAAGVTPLAVGAKDGWPFLQQWDQMQVAASSTDEADEIESGDVTFSESSAKKIVTDFAHLVEIGAFDANASGIDWPSSANDFAAGKAAMMIQGTFALPAIREGAPDGSFGMFPLPYVAAGEAAPIGVAPSTVVAVPSTAKNPELAEKFLEFWAQPDVHGAYLTDAKAYSSSTDATGELDPALSLMSELLPDRADASRRPQESAAVGTAIQSGFQGILVGTSKVDDVLSELDAAQAAG